MPKEKDAKAVVLLGSPVKLINLLIKKPEEQKWGLEKITKGDPEHKQLQHTLVLNRLEKLVGLYSKRNKLVLKPIKGKDILVEESEKSLPVQIPLNSIKDIAKVDKVFEKLTKGPPHEIFYTALLLQIIEGMISAEEGLEK